MRTFVERLDGRRAARFIALSLGVLVFLALLGGAAAQDDVVIPTFTIENVVVDGSVTILAQNFPPNQEFVVTMGPGGTLGIGGTPVGTFYSGLGGTMTATFPIPVNLKGLERIAIRAEATPFYAYNWFDNPVAPLPTPTFSICGVVRDEFVVIRTNGNFPANRDFAVMVNGMGTLGINGTVVGGFNSGPAGSAILASLGARVVVRQRDGRPFITDEGNVILDCHFAGLGDPREMARLIRAQPGVVEHGLFLGMATEAVVAGAGGVVVLEA